MQAEVLDIDTGITYRVRRIVDGCPTLGDVEFVSTADRNRCLESAGGSWSRRARAVIVTVGNRRIAASVQHEIHKGDENNPIVSIVFWGSFFPSGSTRPNANHQQQIIRAADFTG
jgi:hypothetical protein